MLWRAAARMTPGIRILGAVTERGARLDGERRLLQVSDVLRAIEDQFSTAFPRRIWVLGTLRGLRSGMADAESAGDRGVDAFVWSRTQTTGCARFRASCCPTRASPSTTRCAGCTMSRSTTCWSTGIWCAPEGC